MGQTQVPAPLQVWPGPHTVPAGAKFDTQLPPVQLTEGRQVLGCGHWFPHPPQLLTLVSMFVSHPVETWPSQFAKPELQAAMVHWPLAQPRVAFGSCGQGLQLPQWLTSVWVFVSHPFPTLPSQLANPALQVTMLQTPLAQVALPLGGFVWHGVLHWPQWVLLLARFTQVPLQIV
jgi:hypothetical protein